jgi:hypothetical protein
MLKDKIEKKSIFKKEAKKGLKPTRINLQNL